MSDLLKDPMFFYGVAFVIFLALAYRYGTKPILAWLDSEILKIRDELNQARKLRVEAEAALAEYKTKQALAMADAEAIMKHAKEQAIRLKTQAEADLKTALARHEQQAMERIRLAELESIAEVRAATVDMAMEMARKTLASKMDDATSVRLTDQAIADMQKLAASKAEAA